MTATFDGLLAAMREETEPQRLLMVFTVAELPDDASAEERARAEAISRQMQFQHPDMGGLGADEEAAIAQQSEACEFKSADKPTSPLPTSSSQKINETFPPIICEHICNEVL